MQELRAIITLVIFLTGTYSIEANPIRHESVAFADLEEALRELVNSEPHFKGQNGKNSVKTNRIKQAIDPLDSSKEDDGSELPDLIKFVDDSDEEDAIDIGGPASKTKGARKNKPKTHPRKGKNGGGNIDGAKERTSVNTSDERAVRLNVAVEEKRGSTGDVETPYTLGKPLVESDPQQPKQQRTGSDERPEGAAYAQYTKLQRLAAAQAASQRRESGQTSDGVPHPPLTPQEEKDMVTSQEDRDILDDVAKNVDPDVIRILADIFKHENNRQK